MRKLTDIAKEILREITVANPSNPIEKLKKFVDTNIDEFKNLEDSETQEWELDEFDPNVIDYLIQTAEHQRFDYKGICVYYVEEENEIWIENMSAY